jgi:hypothetical protein
MAVIMKNSWVVTTECDGKTFTYLVHNCTDYLDAKEIVMNEYVYDKICGFKIWNGQAHCDFELWN